MNSKGKKTGFTIIELLTVMSIIIILIGMLVPSMNAIRRYSRVVLQNSQFHDISKGLETFSAEFDGYPDSSRYDLADACEPYCGAMKLCEAMVGQDGLGFHPDSIFDDMGKDAGGNDLYFNRTAPPQMNSARDVANLRTRKVKYMEGVDVQIASMETLFPAQTTFDVNCPVLCDVFKRNDLRNNEGEKLGMPILYYKADTTKLTHDPNDGVTNNTNIYNYEDNDDLVEIPPPWMPSAQHPLCSSYSGGTPKIFYKNTKDKTVTLMGKPLNPDSFILISAGWDGLYGTRDDVYNFVEE